MKILKLITACSLLLLGMMSCKKTEAEPEKADFTVEVSNVTAINARLQIDCKGNVPSLVRYMAPTPKETVASEVDMNDPQALKAYLSKSGEAIILPYSSVLLDLVPEMTYVVGVVAINENMEVYDYHTETFTMKDLASMFENTLGDPSNAGNLSGNTLK